MWLDYNFIKYNNKGGQRYGLLFVIDMIVQSGEILWKIEEFWQTARKYG